MSSKQPKNGFRVTAGTLLALLGITATLWLATTGRLAWFIHPRYVAFSVAMALIAGVIIVVAFVIHPRESVHEEQPEHTTTTRPRTLLRTLGNVLLVTASACALLIAPAAPLSHTLVTEREVEVRAESADVSGEAEQHLTGMVVPDENDPEQVFLVTRLQISCCAVDATPIGVPVYAPHWRTLVTEGEWVEVRGSLTVNPSLTSRFTHAIIPSHLAPIQEPRDPYLY